MGKKIPQPELYWGETKIVVHGPKNHQPFKGSIVRSQERSDPGLGALAALFEVSRGWSGSRWNWRCSSDFCWPWQNSTKFSSWKHFKKKGWVGWFLFVSNTDGDVVFFLGSLLWDSEVCWACCSGSFPLWNLRYWEGEGTVREFPPWNDLRVSTPPASVFDLGFGSGVMAAMFLAVEEVEVVGVDLEDKVSVATATLRLKNWDVWSVKGSKNWSLLWESNSKREFRLYIFPTICFCVCLGREFPVFNLLFFFFVGSEVQQSSFHLGGSEVWWLLVFRGFCKGCLLFVWGEGKEADWVPCVLGHFSCFFFQSSSQWVKVNGRRY